MKKWTGFLMFVCLLLLCAFAAADQTVSLSWNGETIGTISVADDVSVLVETQTEDGIVCETNETSKIKTLTMQSSCFSLAGTNSFPGTGQKVVVLDMAWQNLRKGSTASATEVLLPNFYLGTVLSDTTSGNTRTLKIQYLELENPDYVEGGELVSQAVWEKYQGYIKDMNLDFSAQTRQTDDVKQNIKIHRENTDYTLDIYGNSSLDFRVKAKYEGWWTRFTIDVDYDLRIDQFSIETETASFELTIPLEEFGIPGSIFAEVDGEGGVGVTFEKSVGFTLEFYVGFHAVDLTSSSREGGKGPELFGEATASLFVGVEIGPEIDLLEFIELGVVYKMGYHLEYTIFRGHYFIEDKGRAKWHACDDCRFMEIYPQLGPLAAKIAVIKVFTKSFTIIPEKKFDPVYEHYWSKTFDEDGEGHCPHVAYRMDVTVKDNNGKALEGADISYAPGDEKYYKPVMTAKTDRTGTGRIYIPLTSDLKENEVTITASVQDPADPKEKLSVGQTITEKGIPKGEEDPDPDSLSLTIDMRTVAIYFEDSGSGTVNNMPATVYYHPAKGEVRISNNIPEKSGMHFTGWNTAADGSGTDVAPGSQVLYQTDTVLYAQWELVSRNYVVQFSANGGDYTSSMGAVVPIGQPLDISDEYAVWEHHQFLGWALEEDAFEPEYPAGKKNIITGEQQGAFITLFAVWSFDPVHKPLCISFDMNGGPDQQCPPALWTDRNSWAAIPDESIRWDDIHLLQGWSTDPNAAEPEYYAGRTYFFTDDLTLYAVWKLLPVCSVTFADSEGSDPANMPEDILFAPDLSPSVSIPDTVPAKSGRYFHSWNTKKDGSGEEIHPGSVILLYEDTTLYAQWVEIGVQWMVRFNPNGGESAPSPQTAKTGETMTLTGEEPVWTNHIFQGWSLTDDAETPDYPAGSVNVIPYSAGRDMVVLYAVWGFHPVVKPICVSFDMNGGPEDQKPSDQWIPSGAWLALSGEEPVWDGQHRFMGWSLSPWDRTPDYQAGDLVSFTADSVLYAIWDTAYHITEGNGSSWAKNKSAKTGLRFTVDGSLLYFRTLYVDGQPVSQQNYSLSSGSTVIVLNPDYLNGLGNGSHSIRFGYLDGYAEGTFTDQKSVPRTGDQASPALWIALAVLGLAGAAAGAVRRRRS